MANTKEITKTKKQLATKLVLENKRVEIKFIPEREDGNYKRLHKDHIAKSTYPTTAVTAGVPLDSETGKFKKILSAEEQEAFETLMDLNPGDLSIYKKEDNFWKSTAAIITLKSDTANIFNLNDPVSALRFRIGLSLNNIIAPNWENRLNYGNAKWAVYDKSLDIQKENSKEEIKTECYVKFNTIKDNPDRLRDILFIMGIAPPIDSNSDDLKQIIYQIISDTHKVKPLEFLAALNDKDGVYKSKITRAISKGIVNGPYGKKNPYYTFKDHTLSLIHI